MSDAVIAALISSLIGGVLVAVINAIANKGVLFRIERKISTYQDYYPDHTQAFPAITKCIKEQVDYCKSRNLPPVLELKHIAVSMSFSWPNFITSQIPTLLSTKQYEDVKLKIDTAFVDPLALDGIVDTSGNSWMKKSNDRLRDIPDYNEYMSKSFGERFSFNYRTFKNLPHWHGWLITTILGDNERRKHLFLGRTKWVFDEKDISKYPCMTVGHNEYRYYTEETEEGIVRIKMFEQWHNYYYNHKTPLCNHLEQPRRTSR